MTRIGVFALAVMVSALAGCGSSGEPPVAPSASSSASSSAQPSGSVTPSGSPGPSPSMEFSEFTVDGVGPYLLGTQLDELQAANQLAEVSTGGETCPQNTSARGVGEYSDVLLSFRSDGRLYLLVNRSPSIPTPSGAWLGTSLNELKTIYSEIPGQELGRGSDRAYLVSTLSARGILFDLDETQRVRAMYAGDTVYLKASYTDGTDFC